MTKLSGPMVVPFNGAAPKQAVVLLHGYGSDGQDLIGLAGYWRELLPDAMFLAPNGPERCRDNPGGYQWFPIDHDRPGVRFDGAVTARPVIEDFLSDLWLQTGLGPAETILAGFSQGAMMALNVGVGIRPPLMGIVSFSGALIVPEGFTGMAPPWPPICLVHGDSDGVVDPESSVLALETLSACGVDVDYHVQPGAGHTIAPDGLAFATGFLQRLAAAT